MAIVEGVQGGAAVKYSRITYIHIPLLHSSYSMCAACVGAAWVVQHVGVAWVCGLAVWCVSQRSGGMLELLLGW